MDEETDASPPDYVRGNLLSDRYLIPLGLVLAVLLVWIMIPGGSDRVVTERTEDSELFERNSSRDAFAGVVPDSEDMGQADSQNSIEVLSLSEVKDDARIEAVEKAALQREFPVDEVQIDAQLVYQLGVYSRLSSAEKMQQELTRFGLFAHIDKRASKNGIRFSVILGPYQDPDEAARVVATLKREKVSYYSKLTGHAL